MHSKLEFRKGYERTENINGYDLAHGWEND